VEVWIALCVASLVCSGFGAYVAEAKGRSVVEGMIFGSLLGPFGVIAAACLPNQRTAPPAPTPRSELSEDEIKVDVDNWDFSQVVAGARGAPIPRQDLASPIQNRLPGLLRQFLGLFWGLPLIPAGRRTAIYCEAGNCAA
jgi:hypothetical protein